MSYRLLEIDLSNKSCRTKNVGDDITALFLGGRGLGVRLFFDYADPKVEPLSADSPVFFLTGPLTGSPVPLSGRFHSVFRSPLTGTIFDSSCGGRAGVYLKRQGIDGLVITGTAASPVCLVIADGKLSFEDGAPLEGKETQDKESCLKKRFGQDISTILTGSAGERGVLFANAISDRRFFGRGGLGAVLGSKRLFGIVVTKSEAQKHVPAERERFDFAVEEMKKWIHGNPITSQGLPEFGTSVLMNLINEMNLLPYKNFQQSHFDAADSIAGESLKAKVTRRKACYGCPVACGRITQAGEGPEYETLWALGANLGISDLDHIIATNEQCYRSGMDTISLGSSIACYLEAKGIPFGDKKLVSELIAKTAQNKDEGSLIACGSRELAERLGKRELSMSVKGLELPAYHPKGLYGMALAYGTSNRGGCHLRSYMIAPEILGIPKLIDPKITQGKSGIVIYFQNSHAAADSSIFCRFLSVAVTDEYLSRVVSAFTGLPLTTLEYQKIGERIYVLERLFNGINGYGRVEDLLPPRLMFDEYEAMLSEYYRARGYDEEGRPQKEKIKELGLEETGKFEIRSS